MHRLTASMSDLAALCPPMLATAHVADLATDGQRAGTERHAYLERVQQARNAGASDDDARAAALPLAPDDLQGELGAIDVSVIPRGATPEQAVWWHPDTDEGGVLGASLGRDYSAAPAGAIAGTADLLGLVGERVFVADYKPPFGHLRSGLQVRTLALAACRAVGSEAATVSILRVGTDGIIRARTDHIDALDLSAHAALLRRTLAAATVTPPTYHRGPWCRLCPALRACPAQMALVRSAVERAPASPEAVAAWLALASDEEAGRAWFWLRSVQPALKALAEGLQARIEAGPLPLPGGGRVAAEWQPKRGIKQAEAAAWLREHGLGGAVREEPAVTFASIAAAAREVAGKGKPGAAREREAVAALAEKGIITDGGYYKAVVTEGEEP